MAALLGAQTSTLSFIVLAGTPFCLPPTATVVAADLRFVRKAPTSPQIVEVFPVPGGLNE